MHNTLQKDRKWYLDKQWAPHVEIGEDSDNDFVAGAEFYDG
jgi:hypothetical protein